MHTTGGQGGAEPSNRPVNRGHQSIMGRYGGPAQLSGMDAQRAMLDELMVRVLYRCDCARARLCVCVGGEGVGGGWPGGQGGLGD